MACCLSPGCCPTRRPAGGRAKRIRPVTGAHAPAVPSGELQCIKLVPPAPPVEHILQPLKPKEIAADIVMATTRDINTNVTSSAPANEVSDFMAAFFKNCAEIARNNQEALHRALLLDDNDRVRAEQQPTEHRGDFTLSLTSLSSSSSSFVGQPLQPPPQSPTAPSVEAASGGTSCSDRLEHQDAIDDVITSVVTSCCSSTVSVNHEPMAAFIAPTNSPVSSSPGTPSSERRVYSPTTEATPRLMAAPSDCQLSTGAKNSASSRQVNEFLRDLLFIYVAFRCTCRCLVSPLEARA